MTTVSPSRAGKPLHLQFDDNRLLPALYGEHDEHLARLEQRLGVSIVPRGNVIAISGPADAADVARTALSRLYDRLREGQIVEMGDVDAAARFAAIPGPEPVSTGPRTGPAHGEFGEITILTRRRPVSPRSPNQAAYLRALAEHELVFALGPAGTGKTYLAVATAVSFLLQGRVGRIILSRPAVEAGERLGFLPGDLRDKVDPYLRPLYDALADMLPADQVAKRLENGEIEVAPLAFMRGRTLSKAAVILDEAQNTTPVQMKMLLTRLGEQSRMVVTGDLTQVDLPPGVRSGLTDALDTVSRIEGVRIVRFTDDDVVRHPLVTEIVRAYDARDRGGRENPGSAGGGE